MTKENPKLIRALKDDKAPLEYLVLSVLAGDAWVHKGGADKYGIRNWLIDKIKASTYFAAMLRHLFAWWRGEDFDPDSGWSHLYHIRACCAILLDSANHDTLIDDRKRCESINDTQEISDAIVFPNLGMKFGDVQAEMENITLRNGDTLHFTTAWQEPVTEEDSYYMVRYYVSHHRGPTYKGPFPGFHEAQEYERFNPQNLAGTTSILPLNRP